jgi:enamine deaminase RidA (YjgF/YER057c/UK114 family)
MKKAVATGLKRAKSPFEWATLANGILYTAQVPVRADGSIEVGDIARQTALTLDNLKRTVVAAGGTMADVTQVLVYLPHPGDFAGMNAVYRRYFPRPFPNRATVVANLMAPGARIEIVAYAHVGSAGTAAGRSVRAGGAKGAKSGGTARKAAGAKGSGARRR